MFSMCLGFLQVLWLTPTVQRHINLQQKQAGCSIMIGLQVALLHFLVVEKPPQRESRGSD